MTDIVTYCDVNTCEECPRYADDCDGDKRVEHTDLISRADAVEAVASITMSIHLSDVICDKLTALPSADADVYEDYEHATLVDIKEPLKVLVVRCKDCRWWNSETKGCKRNPSVEAWYETDFCKYGERQCNYFGERREP